MKKHLKLTLSLIIGLFMFTGCANYIAKHQVEKMQTFAVRYPGPFKILANTLDPCFNGVAKSDTVIKRDTTTIQGATTETIAYRHDTAFITKTITLPGKTITINKKITDTVTNDRQIDALQAQSQIKSDSLVIVKAQLGIYKTKANKFSLWFWLENSILALALLVFVGVKIYGLIYGGAAVGIVKRIL